MTEPQQPPQTAVPAAQGGPPPMPGAAPPQPDPQPASGLDARQVLVIGVLLIAQGFDHEVPKGYVYFAMAFAVCVEMLNIRMRRATAKPVHLHSRYRGGGDQPPD